MKTNEQEKVMDDSARESLILKGIATSINAMQFPKIKHLNEMLGRFDYAVHSLHDLGKLDSNFDLVKNNEDDNFIQFFKKFKKIINLYEIKTSLASNNPFVKKLILSENIISSIISDGKNESPNKHVINTYDLLLEKLISNKYVYTCFIPIFDFNNQTFSVSEKMNFDNNVLAMNFINKIDKNICIYNIEVSNDFSVEIKYCYLDKDNEIKEDKLNN